MIEDDEDVLLLTQKIEADPGVDQGGLIVAIALAAFFLAVFFAAAASGMPLGV